MTSGNTDQTRRRRMAGWTPREGEEKSPQATSSPSGSSVQTQPVSNLSDENTQAARVDGPARRRRMGQPQKSGEPTPAPAGTRRRMGAAPAQAVPAQESQPVAGQRRMGNPGTAAPTSGAPTRRTRMGSGTTAPAPAESAAAPAPFSADPREVKPPRPAWIKPVAIIASLVVLAIVVVLFARWLRTLEPIQEFLTTYSGHTDLPE